MKWPALPKSSASLGAFFIIISTIFYASFGIWTTLMGDFFDGFTASFIRSSLIGVFMVALLVIKNEVEPVNFRKNVWPLVGLTVSSIFIWGPFYYAVLAVGVSLSLTINYACIVLGLLFFGWLMAGEVLTRSKLISAVMGVLGLILIFSPSLQTPSAGMIGMVAAVISGTAAAANLVILKKIEYGALQTTVTFWITSVIANGLMMVVLQSPVPSFSGQIEWFYLLCFAVASVVASWSVISGMKLMEAGLAGILGLLEIVFGVIFGMVFFGEVLSPVTAMGVILILLAAAWPYLANQQGTKRKVSLVDLKLHQVVNEDLEAVSSLVISSLRHHYSDAWDLEEYCRQYEIENLQDMDLTQFYVVKNSNGDILATGHFDKSEFKSIFVDQNFMGHGIGRWLINRLESKAKKQGVKKVRVLSGKPAVSFYEKLGYHQTGKTFAQGEDIELVKEL